MRWLLVVVVGLTVVVNEVLYDPEGSDGGKEFVELYNTGTERVELGGWRLETGNGAYVGRWRTEWEGDGEEGIEPGGFFVIGEDGVLGAEVVVGLDLQNGPDGCRLISPGGECDLVGWGEHVHGEYSEGAACEDAKSGWSVGRDPDGEDTGDNSADFEVMRPSPGDFNRPPTDLEIVAAGLSRHVPVTGVKLDMVCLLGNLGTQPCGEGGLLAGMIGASRDSTELGFDIEPGSEAKTVLRFPTPGPGLHTTTIWFLCEADRWRENDTLRTTVMVPPPPVVINEIMFRPGSADCEWIELLNAGTSEQDIQGWTLEDRTGRRRRMGGGSLSLPSGGFLVLVEDEEVFEHCHPEACSALRFRPEGGWPTLNDTESPLGFADQVIIRDSYGTVVDSVAYSQRWSPAGTSSERIDPRGGTSGPSNWSAHFGDGTGSPGVRNSVSLHIPGRGSLLRLSSNVIKPGRPEEGLLAAAVELSAPSVVRLRIYDLEGRPVRTLIDGDGVEASRIALWSGEAEDGRPVPTCIYVLVLESVEIESGGRSKIRAPVVVVRR
jgi:hypothetical protein